MSSQIAPLSVLEKYAQSLSPDNKLLFDIKDDGGDIVVDYNAVQEYVNMLGQNDTIHFSNDNEETGSGNLRQLGISFWRNGNLIGIFCSSVYPVTAISSITNGINVNIMNINCDPSSLYKELENAISSKTSEEKAEYLKELDMLIKNGAGTVKNFWSKNIDKYNNINKNARNPHSVALALNRLVSIFKSNKNIKDNRIFMRPAPYDWLLLNSLFVQTQIANPFGFGGVTQVFDMGIHLNSLVYPDMKGIINFSTIVKDNMGEELPHDAAMDSIVQYIVFMWAVQQNPDVLRKKYGNVQSNDVSGYKNISNYLMNSRNSYIVPLLGVAAIFVFFYFPKQM